MTQFKDGKGIVKLVYFNKKIVEQRDKGFKLRFKASVILMYMEKDNLTGDNMLL